MTRLLLVEIKLDITHTPLHLLLLFGIVLLAILVYIKRDMSGKVLLGRRYFLPFYLDLKEAKHIVVFGITGSGKTNTAKLIVKSFKGSKLVLDWNGEYLVDRVAKPSDITIGNLSTLEFCEALASALQLTTPQYSMLLDIAKESKNLQEIVDKLKKYPIDSDTRREIRNALLRRLEPLSYLNLFSGSLTIDVIDTIDLSGLTYDAKRLVANVILRLIYNNPVKELLVLEEAQNLLLPRRPDQPPTSCELIIDEIRKHGMRVLAIAQMPSLVSTTYRNAEYLIIHRLYLTVEEAKNLGLTDEEREKVAKLPNGMCLVLYKGRKALVKVLKVDEKSNPHKTSSISKQRRGEVVQSPRIFNVNDGSSSDMVFLLLEEVKDINKWRKDVSLNVNRISKEVDELKQLIKGLTEKMLSENLDNKPHNFINYIKGEIEKAKTEFNSKVEGIEYSLNYIKERLHEFEDVIRSLNARGGNAR